MTSPNISYITGRVGKTPELRYSQNGTPVASFSLARQPRSKNKASGEWEDGETMWYDVTVFNRLAENVAASVAKGLEVTVVGEVRLETYKGNDGTDRTSFKIIADDVSLPLDHQQFSTVETRAWGSQSKGQGNGGGYANQAPAQQSAPPADSYTDETPF